MTNEEYFNSLPLGATISTKVRTFRKILAFDPCYGDLIPFLLCEHTWTVSRFSEHFLLFEKYNEEIDSN